MNYIINKVVSDKIINPAADKFINSFTDANQDTEKNNNQSKLLNKPPIINNDHVDIEHILKNNNNNQSITGNIVKLIIILFLLYIIISSKFFIKSILSLFGKKIVNDGQTTCLGLIVQGLLLVFFYMIFTYLINKGAL